MDKGIIMRKMHWSTPYLNWITIEIEYEDGSRQGWDYECIQFSDYGALKTNMLADFVFPRLDRTSVIIFYTSVGNHFTADFGTTDKTGNEFVDMVFDEIESQVGGLVS